MTKQEDNQQGRIEDLPVPTDEAEATRGGIVVAGGAGPHVKVVDGTRLG